VDFNTDSGTAQSGSDFESTTGTVSFAQGEQTKTISVTVFPDTQPEGDEDFFVNLSNPQGATVADGQGQGLILNDDPGGVMGFSQATYTVNEGDGTATFTVQRTGSLIGTVTVNYFTGSISAIATQDFGSAAGTLTFGPGETTKTCEVFVVDDAFDEADETFNVLLQNPTANFTPGTTGTVAVTITDNDSGTGANPIDNSTFFVRQHYLDFLGREPDAVGLAFWVGGIESCGADAGCRDAKRIHTSAAFFLSIEFQESGFYVIRVQSAAFGRQSENEGERVGYTEFIRDARQVGEGVVIGQAGAEARLDQNQTAYALRVVTDPEFILTTPISMSAEDYVITLFQRANVFDPPDAEVQEAVDAFGMGDAAGRAAALRSIADSDSVRQREFRSAFVLMQYFGYLRRNPTDPPDEDDGGYQFWLSKLHMFNGDFVRAEMVRAFILSDEYRKRFGS